MMWQDFVFLGGSVLSLLVLVPTLRDSMASVPLGTAAPSAALGLLYGATFFSLGMTLSGAGSLLTGAMWSGIALLRSPNPVGDRPRSGQPEHAASSAAPASD